MNEHELAKHAKNGDKNAFCALYMQYNNRLYRYAYYKLGSPTDAEDAVAECIAEAYEHIASLKDERAFSAWIFKIMYRKCCAIIKQQSIAKQSDQLGDNLGTYTLSYESTELKQALSQLSAEEQDIVLLGVVGGYTSREISSIMGIKSSTIRSKQSRALDKMRGFLE